MLCQLWHSEDTEDGGQPPFQPSKVVEKFSTKLVKGAPQDQMTVLRLYVPPYPDEVPLSLELMESPVKGAP